MKMFPARAAIAAVALALAPALAYAQQAAPAPGPVKTIGVPTSATPQVVPSLIVLNAGGASLKDGKLTLTNVSQNAIVFADRPVRSAGHALTAHLIEDWEPGESFAKDPPNATVSTLGKDGSVKDAVVELSAPKMDGANLVFAAKVLEGDLNGADGPAAVFIDIIGLPFTPLSFAGVARRTAYRSAMYASAASAAAAGAYYHPYGYPPPPAYPYYPPPRCGYYPYPPCY